MIDRLIAPNSPKPIAIRSITVVALALGLLIYTAATAKAQPVCLPHEDLKEQLYANFSEAPAAIAIANNGALVQLFAKRDRSSWTLVMARPGGLSCVLVAGEDWNSYRWAGHDQLVEAPDREATP
jgi:hypothetical protein